MNYYEWHEKGLDQQDLGNDKEAVECYEKALEINPMDKEIWIDKGMALSNLKKDEEALQSFNRALKIDPKDEEAWFQKALTLSDLKKYEEAINCYEKYFEFGFPFGRLNRRYVNNKEFRAIEEFAKQHEHKDKVGGSIPKAPYHITIIPNSVGYIVNVICDVCKNEHKDINECRKDVTDYESW